MPEMPLRMLMASENEADFVRLRRMVEQVSPEWSRLDWVADYDDALAAAGCAEHEIFLVDEGLGPRGGSRFVAAARQMGCATPMILLTGSATRRCLPSPTDDGPDDLIDKASLTAPLLQHCVRHALERSRYLAAMRETEDRFHVVADNAPVLIWVAAPDTGCTFFNRRWLVFTGRSMDEQLRQGWLQAIHPDDREHCRATYRTAFADRREFRLECRLRRADGHYRWFLNTGIPRHTPDGTFAGYIGSCVDITDRIRAEEELAQTRSYARNLIDSSLDMIIAVDAERRIVEFNRAAQETFGYGPEEVVGQHIGMLYADPQAGQQVNQAVRATGSFSGEVANRRKNGEVFPSLLSASVLRDHKGDAVGVMGISRDITEANQAQRRLTESFELLERSRGDLLSILDQLRIGIAMIDGAGNLTFVSQNCQRLLGRTQEEFQGMGWEELCPFDEECKKAIAAMMRRPQEQREKVPVHMETPSGRHYWMEIDIRDDPRNPSTKILFLYDMTEVHDLRRLLDERGQFQDLVGRSEPMQAVYQLIEDLAAVDSTVLIEGETGTGKDLVARALHRASPRRDHPFIAVNCAGLTDSLLGSQLFGHKRGAFTGAVNDQPGVFETAERGTVFLDEIGDISKSVQTSLLRVLQEKEITRLGDATPKKVDVRIVAATNRNLHHEVEEGRFRLDLLYRIRVARINLPPLRQRRQDIPLLVESFLGKLRATTGKQVERVCEEAMGMLLEHPWPGNVRELHSAIEFAVIRCKSGVILAEDLPPEIARAERTPSVPRSNDERERILTALDAAGGNRVAAARILGVSRSTLYRRLAELGIEAR